LFGGTGLGIDVGATRVLTIMEKFEEADETIITYPRFHAMGVSTIHKGLAVAIRGGFQCYDGDEEGP